MRTKKVCELFATDEALDRTVPVNFDNGINESLWKFPGRWRVTRAVRNRDVALSGSDSRSLSLSHSQVRTVDLQSYKGRWGVVVPLRRDRVKQTSIG